VSLFDTAVNMLTYPGVWHLNAGFEPQRLARSAHPSLVPFQAYEAKDGWLVIGCAKEKFWQRLTGVLQRPDLAADPRFASFADRHAHHAELDAILTPILRSRPVAEWMTALRAAAVPSGEVNTVAQALDDPHVAARGLVLETQHPRYGTLRTLASPVRVGAPLEHVQRAPSLGEHTEELLTDLLGLSAAELAAAGSEGAFGPPR
jgi:crotonobetainyl-CoA:carnitine CoA-transferase CaiB-like acyl-CoA transferase